MNSNKFRAKCSLLGIVVFLYNLESEFKFCVVLLVSERTFSVTYDILFFDAC